jgi:hypothetical protein
MKIEWGKVTWYSKLTAVIIYVGTFALAFWLGRLYEANHTYTVWHAQQIPGDYGNSW